MTEKLFSLTRLKCECTTSDAIFVLSTQLSKTKKLLDGDKPKYLQAIKSMEASLDILKKQVRDHVQFKADYARDTMDLVKTRALNVGPSQKKLQTLPYLVGKEKRDRELEEDEEKKKKSKRRRKKD